MIVQYTLCFLQLIITLNGCHSGKVHLNNQQVVPSIYFQLGSDQYAYQFPYLNNVSPLPDSVYVFEQFKEILGNQPSASVTLLPFRDSTEADNLVQRRIEKVQEAFRSIGINNSQIAVLTDHGRSNPVSEHKINALSSIEEQKLARSLNSSIAILLQPMSSR